MARKTNILLVDDDLTIRQSLGNALKSEDFHVVSASNGKEALHEFGLRPIDILLLDLNLGKENGWDTFNKLRSISPLLPVIIMTGHPEQFPAPAAHRVEAFMEKPLDLASLFLKLGELSNKAATRRFTPQSDAESETHSE